MKSVFHSRNDVFIDNVEKGWMPFTLHVEGDDTRGGSGGWCYNSCRGELTSDECGDQCHCFSCTADHGSLYQYFEWYYNDKENQIMILYIIEAKTPFTPASQLCFLCAFSRHWVFLQPATLHHLDADAYYAYVKVDMSSFLIHFHRHNQRGWYRFMSFIVENTFDMM